VERSGSSEKEGTKWMSKGKTQSVTNNQKVQMGQQGKGCEPIRVETGEKGTVKNSLNWG